MVTSSRGAIQELRISRQSGARSSKTRDVELFGYAGLDDKYGMMFNWADTNVDAFREGRDQREFDRLMEIVRRNAASSR